ncbi:MAG: CerR family C-terminal domain-containing protein [Desulfatitalea sp.]|nr:CerR family C-terminal domain-containing protein [Desulfatitalea sp.]NNK02077.1 CerR family C-terminal domain-containing protein [Desulfatitalea sp.]
MKKPLRQDTIRTRSRLMTAAIAVFSEKGYRDATVAEISERAGVNTAAINYHFGDKEALYRESWRQALKEALKQHPPDGGVAVKAPAQERLQGLVMALLDRVHDENNKYFAIVCQELANPTGLLEVMNREEMAPIHHGIKALLEVILGPSVSESEIGYCGMSIVSLCTILLLIRRAERLTGSNEEGFVKVADIRGYAEYVVTFSLAGMAAVRTQAGKGAETVAVKERHERQRNF